MKLIVTNSDFYLYHSHYSHDLFGNVLCLNCGSSRTSWLVPINSSRMYYRGTWVFLLDRVTNKAWSLARVWDCLRQLRSQLQNGCVYTCIANSPWANIWQAQRSVERWTWIYVCSINCLMHCWVLLHCLAW